MLETQLSLRLKNALHKDNVSWRSLLNVGVLEVQRVGSGDSAVPELVWGLLNPKFLVGSKLGVAGQEGQFTTDFVLDAFL